MLFPSVSGRGCGTLWLNLWSKGVAAVTQQNASSQKMNPCSQKMDPITASKGMRLGSQGDQNPKAGKISGNTRRNIWALKRRWEAHDNKLSVPLQWWKLISDIPRERNTNEKISVPSLLGIKLSDWQHLFDCFQWFFAIWITSFFKQFKFSLLEGNLEDTDSPSQKQIPWLKISWSVRKEPYPKVAQQLYWVFFLA